MNRKKSFELTEELHNKIISAAYGEANLLDKLQVLRAVAKNPDVKKLYASYMWTAAEVKQIKEENFTNDFVSRLTQENIPAAKKNNSFSYDFLAIVFARPIISSAVTIVLIASIAAALIFNKPVQRSYNETEILQARDQAKYALSIVDNIFKQTNITLQKEILGDRVTKPIKESIGIVNNILKGEKNETN
jgi:hypothetical protein